MILTGIGAIASIELPAGFRLVREKVGGRGSGNNWTHIYSKDKDENTTITFSYKGSPFLAFRAEAFRSLTSTAESNLFPIQKDKYLKVIEEANGALGNAGINQILYPECLEGKAGFRLTNMWVTSINQKKVLKVEGWFHGRNSEFTNHFLGIFIDGSPQEETIKIEEIYLQAKTDDDFEKYRPFFEKTLNSISWRELIL